MLKLTRLRNVSAFPSLPPSDAAVDPPILATVLHPNNVALAVCRPGLAGPEIYNFAKADFEPLIAGDIPVEAHYIRMRRYAPDGSFGRTQYAVIPPDAWRSGAWVAPVIVGPNGYPTGDPSDQLDVIPIDASHRLVDAEYDS
jgi:hypothetical protein